MEKNKKDKYAEFRARKDERIKDIQNIREPYVDNYLVQKNEQKIKWFFTRRVKNERKDM